MVIGDPSRFSLFAMRALQRRLQPILAEVISFDQTVFWACTFILNNVLLLDETVHSAKQGFVNLVKPLFCN